MSHPTDPKTSDVASSAPRPTNRLARESSPYLLQHATNPVDWYPWGEEAFERARKEDKPILLSVGYSACHWCHVMAHESFEDETTARMMNELFVNVKVDREERPDVDEIYMNAVQLMTHHGGWPMTVFLTPKLEPFYGGTYYPPDDRHGMPSFKTVLHGISEAFRTQREDVTQNASLLVAEMQRVGEVRSAARLEGKAGELEPGLLRKAYGELAAGFDPRNGGFGHAPKFPSTMALSFCLRRFRATGDREALQIVRTSLDKMSAGGIFDHLGFGFHRYSVDERWLVPHFEKMLYDNALLVRLYVEAWQATGEAAYRTTAERVLAFVRRDMTRPGGGFYATWDADSEGEEGKFYVWTPAELEAVLGHEEAELFGRVFDVTRSGNFEHGASILNLPRPLAEHAKALGMTTQDLEERLEASRVRLFAVRERRVKPFRDEKVILAWNGLMLAAMAFAARALGSAADLTVAVETGEFLWRELRVAAKDGAPARLLHTYKDGEAKLEAYLDDTAGLGVAFLELFAATGDGVWVTRARELAERVLDEHEDHENGGFFYTSTRGEALIARSKNPYDNAVPGGNSLAVHLLLRLAALTGDARYGESAEKALRSFGEWLARSPHGFAHMLEALDLRLEGARTVVVVRRRSDGAGEALLRAASEGYDPNRLVVPVDPDAAVVPEIAALVEGKGLVGGAAAAYVCRGFTCEKPATSVDELRAGSAKHP